jgi:hypothetical protein
LATPSAALPRAIGDNGVAKRKSSTKRPTLGEFRAVQNKNSELRRQIFALKKQIFEFKILLEDAEVAKVVNAIKARRLAKAAKLVKYARSAGHKRIPWEAIAETISEGLEDFPSSKHRGRPPLEEKDHCQILRAILRLDSEDRRSKSKIAMALFGILKTSSDSWRYEKVSRAIKFAKTRRFARRHPELKSALEPILAKLPKAPR